jgi:hypothetical protein
MRTKIRAAHFPARPAASIPICFGRLKWANQAFSRNFRNNQETAEMLKTCKSSVEIHSHKFAYVNRDTVRESHDAGSREIIG